MSDPLLALVSEELVLDTGGVGLGQSADGCVV